MEHKRQMTPERESLSALSLGDGSNNHNDPNPIQSRTKRLRHPLKNSSSSKQALQVSKSPQCSLSIDGIIMPRSRPSFSVAAPELPQVSFQKIEDDLSTPLRGIQDMQARSFGYPPSTSAILSHWKATSSDKWNMTWTNKANQEWLDTLNAERQKRLLDKIPYEVFEVVIDRLEKEWFNLAKLILRPELAFPSDDSCAICDDLEGENNNAIVFCDGCNVAVHQVENNSGNFTSRSQDHWASREFCS
ncbi:hypothetical protein B0H13DRAFT_1852346 [Mycena leptocephala]|nr:hypothetical protein B0H13DRAFT_1852346 [Mycena leptocephala]